MAKKVDSLVIPVTTQYNPKGLAKARADFGRAASKIGKAGAMIGKAVAIPAVAAGAALLKIGDDFDKANRTIITATGATGEALKTLQNDFDQVFKNVPNAAGEVADTLATLNTATGATGEVLQGLTESILDVSRLMGEDAAANAALFGQMMNQFNIPAAEGAGLMDKLYKLTQDTGIGFGELTGQMKTYGSVMKNAGFSAEETAVLMGKMHKAGLDWSRVAPGLNKAFRDFAKDGIDAKKGLAAAVREIKNAENETDALNIATAVFGAEGAQRMMTAIRDNVFTLGDLDAALKGADGLIQKTDESTKTLGEEFKQATNELLLLLKPLAGAFIKALKASIPYIRTMFEHIAKAIDWIEDFSYVVYDAAIEVAANFKAITQSAIDLYNDVKTWLVDKFNAIVGGVKQHIEDVKGFFRDLYVAVVGNSYVPDMVEEIDYEMSTNLKKALVENSERNTEESKGVFSGFSDDTVEIIEQMGRDISRGIGDAAADWIVEGEPFFESFKESMKSMAKHFISSLVQMSIEWAAFQTLMSTGNVAAGTGVAAGLTGAGLVSAGAIGVIAGGGLWLGHQYYQDAKAGGGLGAIGRNVKQAGGDIVEMLNPGGWFADGGIVTKPTLAMIGEGGESEAVIPLSKLGMYGGGKDQTIIVNLDGRQIARSTVKNMPSVLRVNGVAV